MVLIISRKVPLSLLLCHINNLHIYGNIYNTPRKSNISAISRVTLGKIERGQMGSVSIKTLDIILNALDYEIDIRKKDKYNFGLPTLDELK